MQVTTVSYAPAYPQDGGQAAGDQAKPGDFDLAMAMVCALISPSPVNMTQGQLNYGDEKTTSTETANLNLADPAVLLNGPEVAVTEKEPVVDMLWPQPADIGDTGKAVDDVAQTRAEGTILKNLLNDTALQQNPVLVMAPFQNPQTPIKQSTVDGRAFQQAAIPDGQAVPMQFRAGTENTRGDSPFFRAALQPEPGVIPQEVQPAQAAVETAPASAPSSQQGVQPVQTAAGIEAAPGPSPQRGIQLVQTAAGIEAVPGPSPQQGIQLVQTPVGAEAAPGLLQQGVQLPLEGSSTVKTENKDAHQEVRLTETLSYNEALQGGKENETGSGKIKAANTDNGTELIRAGEKTKAFDVPQGNTAQPNTAHFNVTQSNPLQLDPGPTTQSTGNAARGVELPDLKERLVQEIRHVFTTQKGEPQTQVQLKLEPEHLGQLTIKLFFNKGELSAHFYTGNSYVKDILEGSMQQLRDTLGQQDLRLNEALVFTGDDGRGGTGRFFDEKNGRGASPYGGYNHRTYGDAQVEPVDSVSTQTDSSRVNYLI